MGFPILVIWHLYIESGPRSKFISFHFIPMTFRICENLAKMVESIEILQCKQNLSLYILEILIWKQSINLLTCEWSASSESLSLWRPMRAAFDTGDVAARLRRWPRIWLTSGLPGRGRIGLMTGGLGEGWSAMGTSLRMGERVGVLSSPATPTTLMATNFSDFLRLAERDHYKLRHNSQHTSMAWCRKVSNGVTAVLCQHINMAAMIKTCITSGMLHQRTEPEKWH